MGLTDILLLLNLVILSIIIFISNRHIAKLKKELEEKDHLHITQLERYYKKEWEQKAKETEEKEKQLTKELELVHANIQQKIDTLKVQLTEKESRYNEVNQDLDKYKASQIKQIDNTLNEYEQRKRIVVDSGIAKYRQIKNNAFNEELSQMQLQKNNLEIEISKIQNELEEERNKRAAINEEILRQREVEEKTDFYRIQLNPLDKDDIEILRNVAPRLRHPDAINKIIWSNYYQKPLAELRKRILTNGDISGIYKITRLKTGEIYIGQTTSIDKRWQEHVKSALGCGTLTSTQLHRAMATDGPEGFTFEVLEAVPKDKLRERESYYIDFYDSKTYGLNSVTGDKLK